MVKRNWVILIVVLCSFLNLHSQSYSYLPTGKVSYIAVPDGIEIGGSTNLFLGAFKYSLDTLMCVGAVNVTPGDPDYIPVHWKVSTFGYEPGDTLLILVKDINNSCNIDIRPIYVAEKGIEDMKGKGDTIEVESYKLDPGNFTYDWDVQNDICTDLNRLIVNTTTINPMIRLNYESNDIAFNFIGDKGDFIPNQSPSGSYTITLNVDRMPEYCWNSSNSKSVIISNSPTREIATSDVIDTIYSQQCDTPGKVLLNSTTVQQEWQSISFSGNEYNIKGSGGEVELYSGFYDVSGFDRNGCPFYTNDIEVSSSGNCEDAFYIFSTQYPKAIDFDVTGDVIIRNRSGVIVRQLNCPCTWNGQPQDGGMLDFGLYTVELPDGSIRKLKYYR